MAICKAHIEQAEHNEQLARNLATDSPIKYKDWAMVIAFYSAVHLIEAFLDFTKGKHSSIEAFKINESPHSYRLHITRRLLPTIASQYNDLFQESLFARYLENNGDFSEPCGKTVSEKGVRLRLGYLADIKKVVCDVVNKSA